MRISVTCTNNHIGQVLHHENTIIVGHQLWFSLTEHKYLVRTCYELVMLANTYINNMVTPYAWKDKQETCQRKMGQLE